MNTFRKRLKKLELKQATVNLNGQPKIILKLWMPNGRSSVYQGGAVKLVAINEELMNARA